MLKKFRKSKTSKKKPIADTNCDESKADNKSNEIQKTDSRNELNADFDDVGLVSLHARVSNTRAICTVCTYSAYTCNVMFV